MNISYYPIWYIYNIYTKIKKPKTRCVGVNIKQKSTYIYIYIYMNFVCFVYSNIVAAETHAVHTGLTFK